MTQTNTFRGRITAVNDDLCVISARSSEGDVAEMVPIVQASGNAPLGSLVLVSLSDTGATIVGRSIGGDCDTAATVREVMAGAGCAQATRTAPIIGHRVTREEEGSPERQLITVVVYEPGRIDSGYGTTASEETVEGWAHTFMISQIAMRGQVITDEHWLRDNDGKWLLAGPIKGDTFDTQTGAPTNRLPAPPVDAYVVENWVKRCDCPIGDTPVSAGAWMQEIWIRDATAWERVLSGEYTGVSIEGWRFSAPDKEE